MLVILAELEDSAALWFVRFTRELGVPCTVLTTQTLSFARRQSHWLSDDAVGFRIETTAGVVLDGDRVTGVLNRMLFAPALAWRSAAPVERDYATAELHAFTVSWLNALPCPVRNRPAPDCLAGRVPPPILAVAAAATAGLDCPPVRIGTGEDCDVGSALQRGAAACAGAGAQVRQLICLDAAVVGDHVPSDVRAAITRFLVAVGLAEALVGLDFVVAAGTWWFAGVTPLPELRSGGSPLGHRMLALFQADLRSGSS